MAIHAWAVVVRLPTEREARRLTERLRRQGYSLDEPLPVFRRTSGARAYPGGQRSASRHSSWWACLRARFGRWGGVSADGP